LLEGGLEVVDEAGDTVLVLRTRVGVDTWSETQAGVVLQGRYMLNPEEPVSRSSHGAIWHARDRQDSRDVLVKSSSCSDGHRREVRALQLLEGHPSAPVLCDAFVEGLTSYLVMEVAAGKNWGGRARCQALGTDVALQILRQAADVTGRLHGAGLLHTDLHPGNLLISVADPVQKVTVLDYEYAVPIGEAGRWRGEVHWGRWEFVPPEQFEGFRELDATTDTHALAGLFCFFAAGHAPFLIDFPSRRRDGWAAVRQAFLDARDVPDLSGIAEHLQPVLKRALHLHPERRFQTTTELVDALAEAVNQRRS